MSGEDRIVQQLHQCGVPDVADPHNGIRVGRHDGLDAGGSGGAAAEYHRQCAGPDGLGGAADRRVDDLDAAVGAVREGVRTAGDVVVCTTTTVPSGALASTPSDPSAIDSS